MRRELSSVSSLKFRYRYCRFARLPNSVGIELVSALWPARFSRVKFVRLPSELRELSLLARLKPRYRYSQASPGCPAQSESNR